MAIKQFGEAWRGILRTYGNIRVESCYALYADMDGHAGEDEDSATVYYSPYLCLTGFSIYSETKAPLRAMLPLTLSVRIDNGEAKDFVSPRAAMISQYSPSGQWMAYSVQFTSLLEGTRIAIPTDGQAFTIHVTITGADGTVIRFDEAARGPVANGIVGVSYHGDTVEQMTTGSIYDVLLQHDIPTGTDYTNRIGLIWQPHSCVLDDEENAGTSYTPVLAETTLTAETALYPSLWPITLGAMYRIIIRSAKGGTTISTLETPTRYDSENKRYHLSIGDFYAQNNNSATAWEITAPGRNYGNNTIQIDRVVIREKSYYPILLTDEAYVDPFTTAAKAGNDFNTVQFALKNIESLPESELFTSDAKIAVNLYYNSADFDGGIKITECEYIIPMTPSATVDAELLPEVDMSKCSVGDDTSVSSFYMINGKFLHGKARMRFTVDGIFKYGDSMVSTKNYSKVAWAYIPGSTYTLHGEEVTAGETQTHTEYLRVIGSKWGVSQLDEAKSLDYSVLWYQPPYIKVISLERYQDENATIQDDAGRYVKVEYQAYFSELDGIDRWRHINWKYMSNYGQSTAQRSVSATEHTFTDSFIYYTSTYASDLTVTVYDRYNTQGIVAYRGRIPKAGVIMEYMHDGLGIAIGKNATEAHTFDIDRSWGLYFGNAYVENYNQHQPQHLATWMRDVDTKEAYLKQESRYA